ncbi:MAG: HAD family hydrolase [Planctomycetaceae bacterium]|nr:HAD family hydrolase [Planctomycetaceae bacterium]|tara:strand:- start:498 stop:1160 length:663 start_codon:yes stop_codon:yes gene_type:complete
MLYSSLIFDLDGTLLDTIDDIGAAANLVLQETGYPTHPLPAYKGFVGSGVAALFQRALPEDDPPQILIDDCVDRFDRVYANCWNHASKPYDKIPELLDQLSGFSYRLAILSNKPDAFTKKCASHFFPACHFDPVLGQRSNAGRKPDPQAVWEIMRYHQSSAEQTVFVGDSEIDVQTAKNAGIFSIGVAWGYRGSEVLLARGVDLLIEHPSELLAFLNRQF